MRRNLRRIVTAILIVSFVIALRPQVVHAYRTDVDKGNDMDDGNGTIDSNKANNKIIVSNQKELEEALKTPGEKTIVFDSEEEMKLKIKEKYRGCEDLVINAPQATVSVSANINTVTIADASSVKIKQAVSTLKINDTDLSLKVSAKGSVESIKILTDESKIQLANQGSVQKISATGTDCDISVQQKGTLEKIVMKNPGKVNIGGSSDQETKISVKKGASGSEISSSVPLALTSKAELSLKFNKGAEKSSVTLKGENAGVSLNNQTNGNITITDSNGVKVDVKSHETAGAGVLTSPKEDQKEEQKQEAAVIYLPTAPSHPADEITNVILDGVECTATTKFDTQGRKTETRYVSKANNKLMKVETFNTSGTIANEDTYFYMAPSDTPSDISIDYIKMTSGSAIEGKLNLALCAYSNDYPNECISYAKCVINQATSSPDSFEMLLRVSEVYDANTLEALISFVPVTGDIANAIGTSIRTTLTPQVGATQFEHLTLTFNSSTPHTVQTNVEICPIDGGFSSGNITETQVYDYTEHTLTKHNVLANSDTIITYNADDDSTPISICEISRFNTGLVARQVEYSCDGSLENKQAISETSYVYTSGYLSMKSIKEFNYDTELAYSYSIQTITYNADGTEIDSTVRYYDHDGFEIVTSVA